MAPKYQIYHFLANNKRCVTFILIQTACSRWVRTIQKHGRFLPAKQKL